MTTTIELIRHVAMIGSYYQNELLKEASHRLIELDKPDCIFTMCSDDSPAPNTLESACGVTLWYLGDDGRGGYPSFCSNCGGAVIVKEST